MQRRFTASLIDLNQHLRKFLGITGLVAVDRLSMLLLRCASSLVCSDRMLRLHHRACAEEARPKIPGIDQSDLHPEGRKVSVQRLSEAGKGELRRTVDAPSREGPHVT